MVSGTAIYSLPNDFLRLISIEGLANPGGIINSVNGLIPVSADWEERHTIINGEITFYPTPTYTLARDFRYKAGLYLEKEESYPDMGEDEKRIKFYYNSKIFIEYYEGTLVALDSLRKLGISIDLQVYDTENNTQKVKEIASLPEIAEMDLIIGPVYAKNISIVADKIAGKNINIISPLDSKDSIIHSVSNLFQVNASSGMRINKMADYINKIDNKNIIIVHTETSKEKKLIEILEQKLSRNGDTTSSLKTLFFKKNSEIYKLQSLLSRESANIIIVPSDDEVVVTNLMSKLSPLAEKFSLTVFGSRRWETFSNMDFEYYSLLNIHYHANTYNDDFSEELFNFENKFKNIFECKPSDYAIHGFDIMFYFIDRFTKQCTRSNKNGHY